MPFESLNPATGKKIKTYKEHSEMQVEKIIKAAHGSFLNWRTVNFKERAALMNKAAAVLENNKETYARIITEEMGKPIKQSRSEIEKCAWGCLFYAEHAEKYLKPEAIETDAQKSFVSFEPLGVILAIMPWNFPFWQVFRFAAPAVMAGNVGLLKHSSNVGGCALAIEDVFKKAGFPADVFRSLLIDSKTVGQVIEHPLVRAVTLTGSTPAGKSVAAKAGAVLKKTVLELGGSDPYIVLEDADLEKAVETCVASRLTNGGQSCIAAKRFIVVKPIKERFEKLFIEKMKAQTMGNPMDEKNTLGPMARFDLRNGLHKDVQKSVKQGAKLLLGGKIPAGSGAYYPPTVLSGVKKGMAAYEQELFGPVATIIEAKDEADAIRIANDSVFGLGAAIFTSNRERGEHLAQKDIEAGSCFVNASVKSDPRLPFGGIKESGYGRELSSYGIKEFVNIKTVYVGK